jgi:hypothetical protein
MSDRPNPNVASGMPAVQEAVIRDTEPAEPWSDADKDADLIELVRERLDIEAMVSDVSIAASLAQVASRADTRSRWLAAFGSPLGKHLAQRGGDLNAALNTLLALAPRHQI